MPDKGDSNVRNRKTGPKKGKTPASPKSGGVVLLKSDPGKWKSYWTRVLTSIVMMLFFIVIIYLGHWACWFCVPIFQALVFHELVTLAQTILEKKGLKIPTTNKILAWWFWLTAVYLVQGRFFFTRFADFFAGNEETLKLMKYHNFICFCSYVGALVLFVASLRKGIYKLQFKHFTWTHMILMVVVVVSSFWMSNLFDGLIWFFVPASLIICNDIWAYLFGFFFGKTQLIELSPKKTWEGFIGAIFATWFFGGLFAHYLSQYTWFICPKTDLLTWDVVCKPSATFILTEYDIPEILLSGLDLIGYGNIRTFWAFPSLFHFLLLATFASLIGPYGGFFASGLKRAFAIKDFGDVIPGHGGFTDRMDCQFLMGVFVHLYYSTFVAGVNMDQILSLIRALSLEDQKDLYLQLGGIVNG